MDFLDRINEYSASFIASGKREFEDLDTRRKPILDALHAAGIEIKGQIIKCFEGVPTIIAVEIRYPNLTINIHSGTHYSIFKDGWAIYWSGMATLTLDETLEALAYYIAKYRAEKIVRALQVEEVA